MGYGAMQLTGAGVWGMPEDPENAIRVLRAAVDAGVNVIDTADAYGPHTNEELIREALHPYDGVIVATKGGLVRTGPGQWHVVGRPMYLRQCVEMSLRRLGLEQIPLWQLHRVDSEVPLADQIGELAAMRDEGKIAHIGLSEVDVTTLEAANAITPIASVQNRYNLLSTGSQPVLDYCELQGIAFLPWFPLKNKELAGAVTTEEAERLDKVADIAARVGATVAQISLAWLLHKSDFIVPIPGTKSLAHLDENLRACDVELSADVMAELDALGRPD
ncbi:MAG: oxidoreductase [Actinobacteria bacterium]|nr:oxidoreductase [Actinomycetota bacterium]